MEFPQIPSDVRKVAKIWHNLIQYNYKIVRHTKRKCTPSKYANKTMVLICYSDHFSMFGKHQLGINEYE